ncbi:unnamed protein product [Hyaloperonospora brassicae]|uniref:Uncharacterized protein n=1 Tax=Hyaloperonospora brassicae TaxID=162125 RepID=A0AAV0UL28_HYABA|nr:unnamed protein product [Hyaloperonospora brassicae]
MTTTTATTTAGAAPLYGCSERPVVMVDVDHTLTDLLACMTAWQEAERETHTHGSYEDGDGEGVKETGSKRGASPWEQSDVESKRCAFFGSKHFLETELEAVEGAAEVLKPLRSAFSLLAITARPRSAEKQTREWLDQHFAGVFDKLVFVDDEASPVHLVARKKELYDDFKVKVAVGSDLAELTEAAKDVDHVVVVGSMPWTKGAATSHSCVIEIENWSAAREVFDRLIKELDLQPLNKVLSGPRLARYTDDLVTVSIRKPAVFYANIINSKFTVQKQETVRLQASEAAITAAVQVAEILRMQNSAITTKITTRYALNRPKDRGGYRVPKIELVLQRIVHSAA